MDPGRWERVQALFHRVADLARPERDAVLDRECGSDTDLRRRVETLLEEDARDDSVLDRDLAHLASQVLAPEAGRHPEDRFGPYRITGVLGEGGMGVVYLGVRDDLGSRAAIKILRDASLSPARRERFAIEQRTLAHLNHPAIASLLDAGVLPNGTPWFAMEHVEGLPLSAWCRDSAAPVPERLRLFRKVCEAVQYAHQHLVVHRDLKPSNILVKPDGSIKLLDFGIAKQLEGLDLGRDQTRTAIRLMTPAYAAPEQLEGKPVGIHTDIYSLGVVLYELLTGSVPFDLSGLSAAEAERTVVERGPERPSARAGGRGAGAAAWADLDVLCLTAMHKDPARRYATVHALIRDLDRFLAGQPLLARPDTLGYRVGKFVRRNRAPVAAAAVVVAGLVGLTAWYTAGLRTARVAAEAEAARAQRIQRFTLSLFEGGDKEAGPADTLRVVSLMDRGVREARALGGDPAVQAELYTTLGSIYQKLGNLPKAESLLTAALDTREARLGPSHPVTLEGQVSLGLLRVDQANYPEAERLVREALAESRRRLPPGHPVIAQATAALSRVLQEKGTYDEAILVGEEAARLSAGSDSGQSVEHAASLAELAGSHFYAGHYEAADSLYHRALATYRRVYGERHPMVGSILFNLGASQFDRGRYPEAERLDREGLAIYEAFYGTNHHETAYGMTMLGRALVAEKRYDEAVALLTRALEVREAVYGPDHPAVASTLNELGNTALSRERYGDAEAAFGRMVAIYRKAYHDRHYLIGIAMSNLASVYSARKEYPRAERLYREVLQRYVGLLAPDHVNVGITHIKLGRALLRQGRFAEATEETGTGYAILVKQADPAVSFLRAARTDLAMAYDSLRQPDKAARYRKELAESEKKP